MSLQVWLPLNGDLHNLGLMPITFSTITANWNAAGKIGQAFSTLNSNIIGTCPNLNGVTTFSLTFWCFPKTNSSITTNWCNIIALGSKSEDNSTSAEFRFESSYGNTYILSHHNNAGEPIGGGTASLVSERDKWYHIAVVVNNETHTIRYYVNGVLLTASSFLKTHNGGHLDGTIKLANESTDPDCLLNDVRIYDHALSDKEVEEIAKGLVLHYKLDDSYAESSTILTSSLTSTAYNGATGKYGYNTDSNLGKIEGYFQGKDCIKIYTLTAGLTARPYTYFSNLFTSDGTNLPAYKALSFDYYTTVATTTWLNIYKLGSGEGTATWKTTNSDGIHSGTYTNSANSIIVKPNEWNHIEVIFHGTTTANAEWGYCINGPNHTSSADNYFLYANILLELNDHITGYGANFHSNMIYDSSGYENNGIITGDIQIDDNTARYSYSIKQASGQYIRVEKRPAECMPKDAITVSLWQYTTSWYNPISCTEGGGWNFENSNGIRFPVYISGVGYKVALSSVTTASTLNAWHMLTGTMDQDNIKIYYDGVEVGTVANGSTNGIGYANNYIFIGGEAQGNNTAPASSAYVGNLSDVRIYATALTAEQVAELYHTSATIDNKGNTYARELVEK